MYIFIILKNMTATWRTLKDDWQKACRTIYVKHFTASNDDYEPGFNERDMHCPKVLPVLGFSGG